MFIPASKNRNQSVPLYNKVGIYTQKLATVNTPFRTSLVVDKLKKPVKDEYQPTLLKMIGNDSIYASNTSLSCKDINSIKQIYFGNGTNYDRQLAPCIPIRQLSKQSTTPDQFKGVSGISLKQKPHLIFTY